MDRRKRREFAPSGESLEDRKLLSGARGANNLFNNSGFTSFAGGYYTTPSLTYSNLVQKDTRIKNIPLFLKSIDPKRYTPPDAVASLQEVLLEVRGRLNFVKAYDLNKFNVLLRKILQDKTLSTGAIAGMNRDVGVILADAGMTPAQIAKFQGALTTLAKYDSQEANPVFVATNDYAILLQLALGVGRRIDTPTAPRLSGADHLKGRAGAVTINHQPRLIGIYDPGTTIRLLDVQGRLLGTTLVARNGSYSVEPDIALSPGRYEFVVQGTDASGELSAFSPPTAVTIVSETQAPHPKGPLR